MALYECVSGSSNPRSHMTWTMDGVDVTSNATESHHPGDYEADSVESMLYLTVTRDMNGLFLWCYLHYEGSVHSQVPLELDVACNNYFQ